MNNSASKKNHSERRGFFVIKISKIIKITIQSCQANQWESISGTKTVVLYPGGSAASPAVISQNRRIVIANPFPGYFVYVETQIRLSNKWGWPGHYTNWHPTPPTTDDRFAHARQLLPEDTIIVRTGSSAVSGLSGGHPFDNTTASITSAPYRLIVTRLGKIT